MNLNDSKLITKAFYFAQKAHEGQIRKYTNEPYFSHCLRVASLTAMAKFDVNTYTAALLHDTLEDTEVNEKLIISEFGVTICNLVKQVTEVSKPEDGNRKQRKFLDLQHYAKGSKKAQTVKLADIVDNLNTGLIQNDPKFARVYVRETAALLNALQAGEASLRKAGIKIIEEYYKNYGTGN